MIFCYTFALAFAINFAFAFKSCSLKDLHRQRSSTRSVRFFERTGKWNEPINSGIAVSFWVRHDQDSERCFDLDFNEWIFILDNRDRSGFVILALPSTLFYNGEFDPGSGWTLATGLTHASRGETALSACTFWTSTGARVSNAYPTCPLPGNNPLKDGLMPYGVLWRHQIRTKDSSVWDGDASD